MVDDLQRTQPILRTCADMTVKLRRSCRRAVQMQGVLAEFERQVMYTGEIECGIARQLEFVRHHSVYE
jgi:hypothetical protein